MTYNFRPAKSFTEQHGVFVGVVGDTNSGKSWSSMRLAQGIAASQGKRVAALDTEGGRLLHLKEHFDFDIMIMGPPHRPDRYLQAAQHAEAQGYGALQIDSFSQVWRGIGGVLDWTDTNLSAAIERRRATAEEKGWRFDETRERTKLKSSASIEPQMSHAMMVNGFLGLRIPIIFAIRGGMTFDPDTKAERFKAQCKPTFPFELTVSFRLAADRKGYIDLSDPASWKMEGAHQAIFRDGDRLSEEHGAKLAAWARGAAMEPPVADDPAAKWVQTVIATLDASQSAADYSVLVEKTRGNRDRLKENRPDLSAEVESAFAAAHTRLIPPAGFMPAQAGGDEIGEAA